MRLIFIFFVALAVSSSLFGQHEHYTLADTLRGMITPERSWWDLQHYELSVNVDIEAKTISGKNIVTYRATRLGNRMQIDLQEPLKIDRVTQNGKSLRWVSKGNAHFILFEENQEEGREYSVSIEYSGTPRVAENPPWDGGFTWSRSHGGKPFVATSNQGIGASIWWPCKDHMYDEPDRGMLMHVTVPGDLVAVCNGRLTDTQTRGKRKTYTWKVVNPINNYGVNINIGDYVHFADTYAGEKGTLDLDFWVLRQHEAIAKPHFISESKRMLQAFEYWMGPYPFYEDSYKLVEVPYWGMEHQSSVTYGNDFKMAYKGYDPTLTGWMDKFDFIIVHESGHEWFANNITYRDMADMWIHESFTTYSEGLFLDYHYGKEAGQEYLRAKRMDIDNEYPMIAGYDVNAHPPGDIYPKGASMLNTLRTVVNNDSLWRAMLRGMNDKFYHQTVTTAQIEGYMSARLRMDLSGFFDQYLRDARVPVLEYRVVKGKHISYRWQNCVEQFNMPVRIRLNGKERTLEFDAQSRTGMLRLEPDEEVQIEFDPNYYIHVSNTMEGEKYTGK